MRRITLATLVLALLAGCTPPAPAPPRPLSPVAAPFATTWNALVDVFAERNIPIKTIDRSSGLLIAELASVPLSMEGKYFSCGTLAALLSDPITAAYNITVRGDSTTSQIRAAVSWRKGSKDCPSKGVFEDAIEGDVKARAEAAARQ
jgi:hypothetical protein